LRDDFLMRAEALPALRERLAVGLHLLGTPQREDLLRIVVEPARRCGYELEDPQLGEDIVAAVVERPNALALLSFTVAALWELQEVSARARAATVTRRRKCASGRFTGPNVPALRDRYPVECALQPDRHANRASVRPRIRPSASAAPTHHR
jgi:hypothetical protein